MPNKIKGLTDKEVFDSRMKFGQNTLVRVKRKGFLRRFFENLGDPIIKILLFALALEVIFTFGNCNLVEISGIVIAIMIATVVSTVSEYSSERAFDKIEADTKERKVIALRNGKEVEIDVEDIVVGDVIKLVRGDKIQADGRIVVGEVSVDQSALNGENIEVRKYPTANQSRELASTSGVFRGSLITDGDGFMRVEKVGVATFYGMVATDVQAEARTSPLKLRLGKLASQISVLGYIAAALVGITYLFNAIVVDSGFSLARILLTLRDAKFLLSTLLHALTLMITVVVVAVPEGLPMMITVVLSANMKRMIKDNVLVKRLVGIETAGSLNILFTDKTGTLTTGRLSVDRVITSTGTCKRYFSFDPNNHIHKALMLNAKYNSECTQSDGRIIGGNATDRAIAEFFSDKSIPNVKVKERTAFSSERKYSSVTFSDGVMLIKGAAEVILSGCSFILKPDGNICSGDFSEINREYKASIAKGERVIAVAMRSVGAEALTFVALIVLKDKIRSGVKEAVERVIKAGIQIVMVTGDNKDTPIIIAHRRHFIRCNC